MPLEYDIQFEIQNLKSRIRDLESGFSNMPQQIGKRFTNALVSSNWSKGNSGWRIQENGDVEFNDGTFRGTLTVGDTSGDAGTFYVEIDPATGALSHYFEGNIRTVLEDGVISFVNPSGTGGGSIYAAAAAANNLRLDVNDEIYNFLATTLSSDNGADLGTDLSRWSTIFLINSPDVSSDIRFKQNIQDLPYGLAAIVKINPIKYERDGEEHLGFSAQELKGILPEIVRGEDQLSIRPDEIIPVLVNAIKELSRKVELLEQKNG